MLKRFAMLLGTVGSCLWCNLPALSRLDMWGEIIDLLGLTILLSYDVPFLKPILKLVMSFHRLQRIDMITTTLQQKVAVFYRTMHGPMLPERLDTLKGPDAAIFLKVFSNWSGGPIPESGINVCIFYLTLGTHSEPWIYAASAAEQIHSHQQPLAGPVPVSFVFTQMEKKIQTFIYGIGFALMALGSVLSIIHIAIG
jgi:hypothetical protein